MSNVHKVIFIAKVCGHFQLWQVLSNGFQDFNRQFYTVVMLLTFRLLILSIPSPLHSFIPGLNLPFYANPAHHSLPFLLHDLLHQFPGLFTDTSEHIRFFYFLVFSAFLVLVLGSVQ